MASIFCPHCRTHHDSQAHVGAPLTALRSGMLKTVQSSAPSTAPKVNLLKDLKSLPKGRDVADLPEPERSEVARAIFSDNNAARTLIPRYAADPKIRARLQGATVGIGVSRLFEFLSNHGDGGPNSLQWSSFEAYAGVNFAWSRGADGQGAIEHALAFGSEEQIRQIANWISHQLTRWPHDAKWCGGEYRCEYRIVPGGSDQVQSVYKRQKHPFYDFAPLDDEFMGNYWPLGQTKEAHRAPNILSAKRAIEEFNKRCAAIANELAKTPTSGSSFGSSFGYSR